MNTAKLFPNGNSQAVRLPKEYRFKSKEVFINKIDEMVVIYPKSSAWKLFEKSLSRFTDDFLSERDQPKTAEKR